MGGLPYHDVTNISTYISIWLRHGGHAKNPTLINRFGWVELDTIQRVFKVSRTQMCGLIAHDKKKRFELLALKLDNASYQPALLRATSGHSIHWLEYTKMLYTLSEYDVQALPAMVHGTKFLSLAGILDGGLNAGREFCMFNMIPHYDARSERGQRFDDWNSLVFSTLLE